VARVVHGRAQPAPSPAPTVHAAASTPPASSQGGAAFGAAEAVAAGALAVALLAGGAVGWRLRRGTSQRQVAPSMCATTRAKDDRDKGDLDLPPPNAKAAPRTGPAKKTPPPKHEPSGRTAALPPRRTPGSLSRVPLGTPLSSSSSVSL
jgi:hypothetical protein